MVLDRELTVALQWGGQTLRLLITLREVQV